MELFIKPTIRKLFGRRVDIVSSKKLSSSILLHPSHVSIQILANYLYLISQFLIAITNLRKDEYGESLENRSRFLFEIVESVLREVDAQRVGVKISPMHP